MIKKEKIIETLKSKVFLALKKRKKMIIKVSKAFSLTSLLYRFYQERLVFRSQL